MAMKIKITRVRCTIDRPQTQKDTVKGLGLTKLNRTVIREDSHAIRGMVRKVQHLVAVEPAE
jgi:large subunit ribosomal protein L30